MVTPASFLVGWKKFGDRVLHHVAVRVEDIEQAILKLKAEALCLCWEIVGAREAR